MIRVRRAKVHRSGGLTEAGKFSWYFFKADHIIYPANFPGLGEALIFFCCFSSIKGRKAGRETPRNSGLQPIAKKQHAVIPNYGPVSRKKYAGFPDYGSISKKKHRRIPDYRPIASKRQTHFAPGSIHSQAKDTEKRLPISHARPTRSLYSLPSTLYSLPSTLYPLSSTDPYSRTTAEAAPRPTPRSNTPSVRRGRYGWIARSDAPPPRSPADSHRTG